jgi:multiple sugar transport system substrate-binding protein
VGSNHTSFAPQYGNLYIDLNEHMAPSWPNTCRGTLQPRRWSTAASCSCRASPTSRTSTTARIALRGPGQQGPPSRPNTATDLAPPETFDELKDQVIFFANPPNLYGTAFAGKDEGITGRFMEILRANGGDLFDENWNPIFNSPEGVAALNWFKDIYDAKAVPAGTVNYTWDDIGQAMAAGQLAIDLDWPGFAGFYNDPAASKIADVLGFAVSPVGSAASAAAGRARHSFSVTEACDNKPAAVSLAAS